MGNINPTALLLGTIAWLLVWGALGGIRTPKVYRNKNLNPEGARVVGILAGMVAGPFLLVPLWYFAPILNRRYSIVLALLLVIGLFRVFSLYDPDNLCVTNYNYVANQTANGLQIGFVNIIADNAWFKDFPNDLAKGMVFVNWSFGGPE